MLVRSTKEAFLERELENFATQIMGEWSFIAMAGIVESVGLEKAVEYLRPHYHSYGTEAWLRGNKEARLQGDSVIVIAQTLKISNALTGSRCDVEIREHGITTTHKECFASAFKYPNAWCLLHEVMHQAEFEAIDPQYGFRFIETMGGGYKECKGVARKKTDAVDRWEDCGTIKAVMLEPALPDNVKRLAVWIVCGWWIMTVEGLIDAVGEERAVEILRPSMAKNGATWGLRFAEMIGMEGHENRLAHLLDTISGVMQINGEVIVRTDRIDEKVLSCPFRDSPDGICRLFHAFIEGLCFSLEPDMVFTRKKKCPSRPFCHWTFKRGTEESEE